MAIRVTRTIAEVAGSATANVRVTRTSAEVGGSAAAPDIRLYRIGVMALVGGGLSVGKSETQTVTFGQAVFLDPYPVSFQQTFTFSQTAVNSLTTPGAAATVTFTQLAHNETIFEPAESQTVTFSQSVNVVAPKTAEQTVTFSQSSGAGLIFPGGLEKTAVPATVTFSQSAAKVLIKASAIDLTATAGTVTFSHNVSFPIILTVPQSVVFTDAAITQITNVVEQTVTFTQDLLTDGTVRPRTITHTLSFSHAYVFENRIDTCRYSPSIGGGTNPNSPTLPPAVFDVVTKESQVTLFFPTTSPTTTVVIRAPEYGDRHRLTFDRINRESRGGTLEVFSDPDWPKEEILEVSFTGLKESESQAVLDFFAATLGLTVGFTDWNGRTWFGVIVDPNTQLIRARRGIVDMSFEFEGEPQ